jgi:hypothetical protein
MPIQVVQESQSEMPIQVVQESWTSENAASKVLS